MEGVSGRDCGGAGGFGTGPPEMGQERQTMEDEILKLEAQATAQSDEIKKTGFKKLAEKTNARLKEATTEAKAPPRSRKKNGR